MAAHLIVSAIAPLLLALSVEHMGIKPSVGATMLLVVVSLVFFFGIARLISGKGEHGRERLAADAKIA